MASPKLVTINVKSADSIHIRLKAKYKAVCRHNNSPIEWKKKKEEKSSKRKMRQKFSLKINWSRTNTSSWIRFFFPICILVL